MDYHVILGILALIIGLVSYIPYLYHVLKNKTKPHIFSWFIWGLLMGIAFIVQLTEEAGPGSWIIGLGSASCLFIATISYIKWKKDYITKSDWICFIAAILGIIFWVITKNPLIAVIIITGVDAIAFIPTFRKAYHSPHEETVVTYAISGFDMFLSILALENLNLTTALYPASLVVTNTLFSLMTVIRRHVRHK